MLRTSTGFRPAEWDEALDFAASRMRDIQQSYGPDAVAVYGGASLITEKAYLLGKFARLALGTRHIDYNGRLCMVSAGVAYKLAFGIDRSPIPWSDIPQAEVLFIIGANIGECAPITTNYVWQCRENGGRLIVADPRITPISRNADLYLPVRPGTDLALLLGMLHVILRDGLEDRDFIAGAHRGVRCGRRARARVGPAHRRAADRRPSRDRSSARHTGLPRRTVPLPCTHAASSTSPKASRTAWRSSTCALATGNIGREGAGCAMMTGQGNGQGGREHGQKCDQLPGARSIQDPEAREHVASVWGIRPEEIPQAGLTAAGDHGSRSIAVRSRALLSICFNPLVSLPDAEFHSRSPREARILRGDRFLFIRDGAASPTWCWRAACRRRKRA